MKFIQLIVSDALSVFFIFIYSICLFICLGVHMHPWHVWRSEENSTESAPSLHPVGTVLKLRLSGLVVSPCKH